MQTSQCPYDDSTAEVVEAMLKHLTKEVSWLRKAQAAKHRHLEEGHRIQIRKAAYGILLAVGNMDDVDYINGD